MTFKLNWVVYVWRMASLGHLNKGRQLGYLLVGNGGGVKQLISSSYTSSPSSWSLLSTSRGIRINSCPCNCSFTNTFSSEELDDHIKPRNHPLLSSKTPYLLIPSPKDKDEYEVIAAAIAKEVGGSSAKEFGFPDYCFYSLADRKLVSLNNVRSKSNIVIPDHAICVGGSHGWLAYLDSTGDPPALFLTNPLDMVSPVPPTIRLPPLETLPFLNTIVMSSAPSSDNDDCTVMVCVGQNTYRLAFCKLGDSLWTYLENPHGDDPSKLLAYSSKDQLFYCRHYLPPLKLVAWDLRNPFSPRRIKIDSLFAYGLPDYPESERILRDWYHTSKDYVVVDSYSGDVLLVVMYRDRISFRTIRIDVYRLTAAKSGWDYVTDLGDGVLFVGYYQAFMLSARDFAPGVLIPNSVYFTVDEDEDEDKDDMGIYNMRDFTITPIFPSHLHPFNKIHHPRPIWFTPNPWNN